MRLGEAALAKAWRADPVARQSAVISEPGRLLCGIFRRFGFYSLRKFKVSYDHTSVAALSCGVCPRIDIARLEKLGQSARTGRGFDYLKYLSFCCTGAYCCCVRPIDYTTYGFEFGLYCRANATKIFLMLVIVQPGQQQRTS